MSSDNMVDERNSTQIAAENELPKLKKLRTLILKDYGNEEVTKFSSFLTINIYQLTGLNHTIEHFFGISVNQTRYSLLGKRRLSKYCQG